MVWLSVPRTAICSTRSAPAAEAPMPTALNASFICAPDVRNNWTARAVCPVSCSTHFARPIASAWPWNRPYMVPM